MRLGVKWAVGLICALGVVLAGAHHWPVASANVSVEIDRAISPRVGLHLRPLTRASVALLPWPSLRVVGLELADADGRSVLSAPAARFPLSLAALIRGRIAPDGASLYNPTAFIDLDASPVVSVEQRALPAAADDAPPTLLSHVRMHGGLLHLVSATHQFDTLIEGLDGSFDWPSLDGPMKVALAGAWRDEKVTIEGGIDNPQEALKNQATGVTLSVASRPLSFTLNGKWGGDANVGFAGEVSARTDSLRALERLFGAAQTPLIVGDAISLEGEAQTKGASIMMSDARLDIAGQRFDGALTLSRTSDRTTVSGTLAADTVDLEPLIGAPPSLWDDQGGWSAAPFVFAPGCGLDLDLRISAAHVAWRGRRLDDVAGSLMCKDSQVVATLLEASAYQGVLKGELAITRDADGLETQMAATLADADIGAALGDFGWRGYIGRGGFDVSLRSTGLALADSVASLAGSASLSLQAGVVNGVNIEEAMRRSQRRPIDLARDMTIGQTTFTQAQAKFMVANGAARISGARVEGPGSVTDIEGVIDLAARKFHMLLAASQVDAEGSPSANAARLSIVLDGPWTEPTVAAVRGGG
jgi:AsmA protein